MAYVRTRLGFREQNLRKLYGLTEADFNRRLTAQGGRCAICRTDAPGGKHGRFHVDHDHATGAIRGLLCDGCNKGLGCFRDSTDALRAAVDYLRLTTQTQRVA